MTRTQLRFANSSSKPSAIAMAWSAVVGPRRVTACAFFTSPRMNTRSPWIDATRTATRELQELGVVLVERSWTSSIVMPTTRVDLSRGG
jgi:hypothetical protein